MITDLKIICINDHELLAGSVPSGIFAYKSTYKIPTLFGDLEKVFNCQTEIKISNDYIKNKIIEYHFN